eukprot:3813498-Ditylum_brightwellii.AAC.1
MKAEDMKNRSLRPSSYSPRLVETQVRTCVKEASGSAKPSGCSMYGMPPCRADYSSGYVEQFAETYASGLDPV